MEKDSWHSEGKNLGVAEWSYDGLPDFNSPRAERETSQSLVKAEIMDEHHEAWDKRVDRLIDDNAMIYAIRGAGSVNGIDPEKVDAIVKKIRCMVRGRGDPSREVALIFDGDPDDREHPDIGAVFGKLADSLKDEPRFKFLAVQKQSWYYPSEEGASLASATKTPYETFVFPDKEDGISGGHSELTQSDRLANYKGFATLMVGPAGDIAKKQLADLNSKFQRIGGETWSLPGDMQPRQKKAPVFIIEAGIDRTRDAEFENKLVELQQEFDAKKVAGSHEAELKRVQTKINKATKNIEQRTRSPYGTLVKEKFDSWTGKNEWRLDEDLEGQFDNLDIEQPSWLQP